MYSDYFRPLGIEREIMLCLRGGPGKTIRLILFRGPGLDFTERDRGLLALLRPHLYEAYREGERRARGVPSLTGRQWQTLRLVAAGYSNAQIARRLFISEGTVRKHLENIFERLDVTNRLSLGGQRDRREAMGGHSNTSTLLAWLTSYRPVSPPPCST